MYDDANLGGLHDVFVGKVGGMGLKVSDFCWFKGLRNVWWMKRMAEAEGATYSKWLSLW